MQPLIQCDLSVYPQLDTVKLAGGWAHVSGAREWGGEAVEKGQIPQTCPMPIVGLSFDRPRIMGILNVTPDSFSDGGLLFSEAAILTRAEQMIADGADILDIGGESTRPGAKAVDVEVEIKRVVPAIRAIRAAGIDAVISIDTRNAKTAQAALDAGASMVNDVSGFTHDPEMSAVVADFACPAFLMHMQGTPETMQDNPTYDDVVRDVALSLEQRVQDAEAAGIQRSHLILDPGIGFGKTQAHNLALLQNLTVFHSFGLPLLLGVSRKGFVGKIGQEAQADQRAPGSLAVGLHALAQGVQILRVHDVRETMQGMRLWWWLHKGTEL